MSDDDVRI